MRLASVVYPASLGQLKKIFGGYFEIRVKQKISQKWTNDWRWRRSDKTQFFGDFRTLSAQINYHLVDKCSNFVMMFCFPTENVILVEKTTQQ